MRGSYDGPGGTPLSYFRNRRRLLRDRLEQRGHHAVPVADKERHRDRTNFAAPDARRKTRRTRAGGGRGVHRSGTESLQTHRWRELDSKFQFGATLGSLTGLRDTRSGQSNEQERSRLREVTAIGPKRAERIIAGWAEPKMIREIMLFLHSNGVGTSRAMRIYKTYGADAIRLISENP